MQENYDEKEDVHMYSPKCSPNDITKMVDLPGTKHRKEFSAVDSVVKRSWSAKYFNGSKMGEDKTTQQSYKYSTLLPPQPK